MLSNAQPIQVTMSSADERQSSLLKTIADETRLRLVRLLSKEVLNVQELCDILELPQPRVSRHLSVLRTGGIVNDQREGSRVYYQLAPLSGELALIADYVRGIAEQDHPDLQRLETCLRQRTRYTREFAERRAHEWDEIGAQLHSSTATLTAIANLAPRGLTVADLGTGTGLLLPILSSFADRVYAVDQSEEMLEYAARRCEEVGIDNVEFICAELEGLGKTDLPPCDCLILHFVLHQIARPAVIIKSLISSLQPRGRLVVVDRLKHDDDTAMQKYGSLWLGFEAERVQQWLTNAGLEAVALKTVKTAPVADPNDEAASPLFVAAGQAPG